MAVHHSANKAGHQRRVITLAFALWSELVQHRLLNGSRHTGEDAIGPGVDGIPIPEVVQLALCRTLVRPAGFQPERSARSALASTRSFVRCQMDFSFSLAGLLTVAATTISSFTSRAAIQLLRPRLLLLLPPAPSVIEATILTASRSSIFLDLPVFHLLSLRRLLRAGDHLLGFRDGLLVGTVYLLLSQHDLLPPLSQGSLGLLDQPFALLSSIPL
mmetsp:Transcript_42721/g.92881  ORF Transcript_42721/g.92881 Transcript_42721/m.92881 type:complete len:216 (+) Transcript_42721:344-991(+)